jgi:hypothetical protein
LAVKYALPDAKEQYEAAEASVKEAKASVKKAQAGVKQAEEYLNQPFQRLASKQDNAESALEEARDMLEKKKFELGEEQRVLKIATLGMVNQSLLFTMGLGQAATGVVEMIAAPPAAFNITPVLTGAAANTAILATSVALSAIYLLRGATMVFRAKKNLDAINELADGLHAKGTLQEAIDYMKGIEAKGHDYMKRRMDVTCLKGKSANACTTDVEKKEYLGLVDKAIYSQALKHKVAMCIGFAMIIGAVLGIIAANLATGGVPLLLVSLGSALFFLAVEIPFLVYDSPKCFEKYRDFFYARHKPVEFPEAAQPQGVVIDWPPVVSKPEQVLSPLIVAPVTSWYDMAARGAGAIAGGTLGVTHDTLNLMVE